MNDFFNLGLGIASGVLNCCGEMEAKGIVDFVNGFFG